jgi:hypothetical protein
MKRTSRLFRIALLVVTCLVGLSTLGPAAAAQGADHPVVGTWRVYLGDDPHVHGLLTHHADGTMTSSDPVTMAIEPGMTGYQSSAYGVWEATGPNTVAYTYHQFTSDADGNVIGLVTVSGEREISADGQAFGGAGVFQLADLDGNVFLTAPAPEVRGERMTIVPAETLATPAT